MPFNFSVVRMVFLSMPHDTAKRVGTWLPKEGHLLYGFVQSWVAAVQDSKGMRGRQQGQNGAIRQFQNRNVLIHGGLCKEYSIFRPF